MKLFDFRNKAISFEAFQEFSLDIKLPLGKRVEHFFEFYIEKSTEYRVVEKNIQIIANKQTLGEFDFFLEHEKTKKLFHVELVYKFYVHKEHSDEIASYLGPNNHDSLEEKLSKLEKRQFPLLYREEAQEALSFLEGALVEQRLCFLGNVFLPKNTEVSFEKINPKALRGRYVSLNEFIEKEHIFNTQYFIPEKQDWLIEPKYGTIWYKFDEVLVEMEEHFEVNVSLLLWLKIDDFFETIFVLKD